MPTLNEVFGVSNTIPKYTYVDRSGLDNRFKYSLQRNAHIVLHGGSKQGQTVLRKKNLPEAQSVVIQCRALTTCLDIYSHVLAQIGTEIPVSSTSTTKTHADAEVKGGFGPLFGAKAGAGLGSEAAAKSETVGKGIGNLHFVSEQIIKTGRRVIIEDFHYMPEEGKKRNSLLTSKRFGI